MSIDPRQPVPSQAVLVKPQRLFLFEPGWGVSLKSGSEKAYCYMMAPGQDFYHRLLDGEIYFYHGDEKLCLACAQRRGLIASTPRGLREPLMSLDLNVRPVEPGSAIDLAPRKGEHE
jgi:hypothetical protein